VKKVSMTGRPLKLSTRTVRPSSPWNATFGAGAGGVTRKAFIGVNGSVSARTGDDGAESTTQRTAAAILNALVATCALRRD
jgi:hypothetical protein